MPSTIRTINELSKALNNSNTEEASINFEIYYRDINQDNGIPIICDSLYKNLLLDMKFAECGFMLTDDLCNAIKVSTHLKGLQLPGNGIEKINLDKLCAILSSCSIKTLNLANNNIDDEALLHLIPFLQKSPVTTLILTGNRLTDASVSALQNNQHLQEVNLRFNKISPEKIKEFDNALANNKQASNNLAP